MGIDLAEAQPLQVIRPSQPSKVKSAQTVAPKAPAPKRPSVASEQPSRTPPNSRPSPPKASISRHSYPLARQSQPKKTVVPSEVLAAGHRTAVEPSLSDEVEVEANFSWRALPAAHSPMNGHLVIEVNADNLVPTESAYREVMVLVDVSGSMTSRVEICDAIVRALGELPVEDHKTLVLFASRAKVISGDFNSNTISKQVDLESSALGNGTNMLDGILTALQTERDGRNRATRFILISDGLTANEKNCLIACQTADIPITVFGMGKICNRSLLEKMAKSTNGRFQNVASLNNFSYTLAEELRGIPRTVSRDTRLTVTFAEGVKVSGAYRLAPAARNLGKPEMRERTVDIPLGDLRQGETVRIAFEVLLPARPEESFQLASGRIVIDGRGSATIPSTAVEFSTVVTQPERNLRLSNVAAEVQWAASRRPGH